MERTLFQKRIEELGRISVVLSGSWVELRLKKETTRQRLAYRKHKAKLFGKATF